MKNAVMGTVLHATNGLYINAPDLNANVWRDGPHPWEGRVTLGELFDIVIFLAEDVPKEPKPEEMVKMIAKALFEDIHKPTEPGSLKWEETSRNVTITYDRQARTAVRALGYDI